LDERGWTYAAIGDKLDMREQTVLKWRKRFLTHRRRTPGQAPAGREADDHRSAGR
jgi:hypothetical protein